MRKKEPMKMEPTKELSPRKEERRAAPFIFSCNGFFKLIIKSLWSYFQKIKVFKHPFIFECKVF